MLELIELPSSPETESEEEQTAGILELDAAGAFTTLDPKPVPSDNENFSIVVSANKTQ